MRCFMPDSAYMNSLNPHEEKQNALRLLYLKHRKLNSPPKVKKSGWQNLESEFVTMQTDSVYVCVSTCTDTSEFLWKLECMSAFGCSFSKYTEDTYSKTSILVFQKLVHQNKLDFILFPKHSMKSYSTYSSSQPTKRPVLQIKSQRPPAAATEWG